MLRDISFERLTLFESFASCLWAKKPDEDDCQNIASEDEEPERPATGLQSNGRCEDGDEDHEPLPAGEECCTNVPVLQGCNFTRVEKLVCLPAIGLDRYNEEEKHD